MVAVNRIGTEDPLTFYGSSFISDPYGRKLVQAPRDEPAVLVADLDLDQRRDWLALFPFLTTRRPDAYGSLAAPVTAHAVGRCSRAAAGMRSPRCGQALERLDGGDRELRARARPGLGQRGLDGHRRAVGAIGHHHVPGVGERQQRGALGHRRRPSSAPG